MQDPNEDTDWNDVLRRFGIIPPKQEEKDEDEEITQIQNEAAVKPYENMTLEALKETEGTFQEEERAIETYRQNRLRELKCLQKKKIFGELVEIPGNLYVKEVTNAKEDVWVVLHLYRSRLSSCLLLNHHLAMLADKFPETKFLKVIVDSCIAEYQDHCLPTLLIYQNGRVHGHFTALRGYGNLEDLEWKLAAVGAVKSDMDEDPKKIIVDMMTYSLKRSSIHWKDIDE
uniref:Phosducin like 2 n=1 Tax=Leptobrachium leishanense TaxID=445787 RepID=A0A8C5P8M7_9ANUR